MISRFAERYSGLNDDELVHIALTSDLVPEATSALQNELEKRGLSDLSAQRNRMIREVEAEDIARKAEINRRNTVSTGITKWLYALGVLALAYGLYVAFFTAHGGGDDAVLVVIGPAIIFGAWLRSRLAKLWTEKVLLRKPPQ